MKKNLKIINLKKIKNLNSFFLIIILLSFVHLFDGFENTFKILIRPYETRMQLTHGYCQNESYGFYSDVVKKYQINKYKVYQENYDGYPLFRGFFYKKKTQFDEEFYLLLNSDKQKTSEFISVEGVKINTNKLELVFNKKNCYLFKKK